MALRFDIRTSVRLTLALLLFLVAVGPVCLLMTPSMAMANDVTTGDCGAPSAPSKSTLDCPHKAADDELQSANRSAEDAPLAPVGVLVGATIVPTIQPLPIDAAALERPVAHLTPLRL